MICLTMKDIKDLGSEAENKILSSQVYYDRAPDGSVQLTIDRNPYV
jgi:hypothetical protein